LNAASTVPASGSSRRGRIFARNQSCISSLRKSACFKQ
jgi:hypothetical protein